MSYRRRPIHDSIRSLRARARTLAVRFGGLPHSVGTIDSPDPHVAHDVTALWLRNFLSRAPIVDPTATETVTMTSHGSRLDTAWIAIESIGRGHARPKRIILWLDQLKREPDRRLRALQRRGLEIIYTAPGFGVHTKYWPYLTTQQIEGPLVTSDDDILYPATWLEQLRDAHRRYPEEVIAHRAHRISMSSVRDFVAYIEWGPATTTDASFAHFATSVSGQLLPPRLQRAIRDDGTAFLETAPAADDIWLHREAVLHGFPTRQVSPRAEHWPFVPSSQTIALSYSNVFGGENDRQLAASHNEITRQRIWEDRAYATS